MKKQFLSHLCRNEVCFDQSIPEEYMNKILEAVRETPENFEKRKVRDNDPYATPLLFDFNSISPADRDMDKMFYDICTLSDHEFKEKYRKDKLSLRRHYRLERLSEWGTPENAKNVLWIPQSRTFIFDTMSRPATPVISALHFLFPDARIEFEYYHRNDGFIGGCEFIPEKDWSPDEFAIHEVCSLEEQSRAHKNNEYGQPQLWMAGTPYNPWISIYMGFKGG